RAQFQLAVLDGAAAEIADVLVRQPERRKVGQLRRGADAPGEPESTAALELFDVREALDVTLDRRLDPRGAEDRQFLAGIGRQRPCNGLTGQQLAPVIGSK